MAVGRWRSGWKRNSNRLALMDSGMKRKQIFHWIPALVMMGVIFWFSSQPSYNLPNFNWADRLVKKGGHMVGYGVLGLAYWYGFGWRQEKRWLAWMLVILYALSDEYHQSFVPGRNASIWDVLVFDNLGGLIALWLAEFRLKRKRPGADA